MRPVWRGATSAPLRDLPSHSPARATYNATQRAGGLMQRSESPVTTQDRSVVTVLGPVSATSLGVTDSHDHLFLRTPALPGQEFEDLERSSAEVRAARASG